MGTFYRENNDGFLTFDNILKEENELPAMVTAVPIQRSAQASDHRQQQQRVLNVQGLITETPLEAFIGDEQFDPFDALAIADVSPDDFAKRQKYAVEFWQRAQSDVLEYYSQRLGFIPRLMIRNIRFGVTAAHHLIFDIEAVQVEFSESETVALPPIAVRKAKPSMCPAVDVGSRVPVEVPVGSPEDKTPLLLGIEWATDREGSEAIDALNAWFGG